MNKYALSEYAEQIRDALDIRQVAEVYGLKFSHNGYAPCPFHSEKTASFKVQNDKFCHCFGCNINADVIKLTGQLFDLRFMDAVRKLNSDFNIGLPLGHRPTYREQREIQRKHNERMAAIKAERERKKAWEAEYIKRLDEWIRLDRNRREYAPMSPDEPINPLYVEAVTHIDYAAYLIDCLPEHP